MIEPACCRSAPVEYEHLVVSAREAAEHLLERYFGLAIEKAIDLSTRGGFDLAVARLSAELSRHTAAADADALRAALRGLDVDWKHTSAVQRRELVAAAMAAARRATAKVPAKVEVVFGRQADHIVAATREDARRRHRLTIGAEFNAFDRRIVRYVARSQSLFVTGEYGRRHQEAERRAHEVVALGLEQGLGRDDIARDLHNALGRVLTGRSSAYWDVVAGAFTGTSRSYGQMSSYAEAGIHRYQISAVLDEATTTICRMMDGRTFAVSDALDLFDRVERLEDPRAIKATVPWVREGTDKTTGRGRLFVNRGGENVLIADVTRSGAGRRDDRGEFVGARSERELAQLGVTYPPFHGRCRSSTAPA